MAHKTIEARNIRVSYREGTIEREHIFENHCHSRYEMITVFEGSTDIVVDGRKYTLGRAETVIIAPLVYHSVFVRGDVTYKRATVLFEESEIPDEVLHDFKSKLSARPVLIIAEDNARMELYSWMFGDAFSDKLIPLIKGVLIESVYTAAYRVKMEAGPSVDPTVKAITKYIDAHINEKILLDGIAEELFISKSTVSHVFRDVMKISPKQYIIQRKLAYAASLISAGTPASSAAREIGYENYAAFYKIYKKVFGESPRIKKH